MRKTTCSLVLALAASTLLATAAAAQIRLDRLEVVLWPEYDRPEVLVILNVTLSADTALPSIVPLPMPTAAGSPHAVAKQGPNGNLLVAQYSVEVDGDWSTVKVLTEAPTIRLEYYAPLAITDSQRRHRFYWPEGLPIAELSYEVLHPMGASSLSLSPPADGVVEADGLTFYSADLGPRSGTEPFSITLAYTKQSSALSSPAIQAAPPSSVTQPVAAEAETSSRSLDWVPLALIALAVLVGLWLMFRRPGQPNPD